MSKKPPKNGLSTLKKMEKELKKQIGDIRKKFDHFRPGRAEMDFSTVIFGSVLMLPSGLTALGQHQNSRGAGNTHDPTGWGCNNVSFLGL